MHITETSVLHMDMYIGGGPALIYTEEHLLDGKKGAEETRFGLSLSAGIRLLFAPRWAFKVELRDLIHKAKNVGADETLNNLQVNAGFSIFFGSFPDYTSL